VEVRSRDQAPPFTTKDGSTVRELAHPRRGGSHALSLAEATVPAGGETAEHLHRESEEIYLFTVGAGRMRLGEDEAAVAAGALVVIPPGIPHKLWADPDGPLVLLCMCSPAYSDADTELTGR
jgi:mannose-6-phosphate isomerase-like protein (cupin superfamily)